MPLLHLILFCSCSALFCAFFGFFFVPLRLLSVVSLLFSLLCFFLVVFLLSCSFFQGRPSAENNEIIPLLCLQMQME